MLSGTVWATSNNVTRIDPIDGGAPETAIVDGYGDAGPPTWYRWLPVDR